MNKLLHRLLQSFMFFLFSLHNIIAAGGRNGVCARSNYFMLYAFNLHNQKYRGEWVPETVDTGLRIGGAVVTQEKLRFVPRSGPEVRNKCGKIPAINYPGVTRVIETLWATMCAASIFSEDKPIVLPYLVSNLINSVPCFCVTALITYKSEGVRERQLLLTRLALDMLNTGFVIGLSNLAAPDSFPNNIATCKALVVVSATLTWLNCLSYFLTISGCSERIMAWADSRHLYENIGTENFPEGANII